MTRRRAARSAATYETAANPSTIASRKRPICSANGMIADACRRSPTRAGSGSRTRRTRDRARRRDRRAASRLSNPSRPAAAPIPTRERGEHEPDRAADERTEQRERRGEHERRRDDHLLALGLRRDRAPRSRRRSPPTSAAAQRDAQTRTRSSLSENAVKNARKPTLPREHRHRAPGRAGCSAGAARPRPAASSLLSSAGARGRVRRDLEREDRRDDEHDRGEAQRPVGAEERAGPRPRARRRPSPRSR